MTGNRLSDALHAWMLGKAGVSWQDHVAQQQAMDLRKQQADLQQQQFQQQQQQIAEEKARRDELKKAQDQYLSGLTTDDAEYRNYAALQMASGKVPESYADYKAQTNQLALQQQQKDINAGELKLRQDEANNRARAQAERDKAELEALQVVEGLNIPAEQKMGLKFAVKKGDTRILYDFLKPAQGDKAAFTPMQIYSAKETAVKASVDQVFDVQLKRAQDRRVRAEEQIKAIAERDKSGMGQMVPAEQRAAAQKELAAADAELYGIFQERNDALGHIQRVLLSDPNKVVSMSQPEIHEFVRRSVVGSQSEERQAKSKLPDIIKSVEIRELNAGVSEKDIKAKRTRRERQAQADARINGTSVEVELYKQYQAAEKSLGVVDESDPITRGVQEGQARVQEAQPTVPPTVQPAQAQPPNAIYEAAQDVIDPPPGLITQFLLHKGGSKVRKLKMQLEGLRNTLSKPQPEWFLGGLSQAEYDERVRRSIKTLEAEIERLSGR